jgi:multidrug efflux pump subunit AcrA (membrane-fusion protein)
MFFRCNIVALLLAALLTLLLCGCKKTANAPLSTTVQTGVATADSSQNPAIELEIVAPQAIAGGIVAPGKFLVPENRMAVIGPVHEGRLVRLYAGQGSSVKKGQKLADLQSPDIDDAEADYLKALADYHNAQRTAQAELKLAQSTYDRTKMLYEKTITPGKNLLAAEHDLEVAKATSENTINSTKAVLTAARHRLLILGLK